MNAVDTNVLVYARDPRDARKQQTALELVRSLADGVLLWQVACEYINVSRRMATTESALEDVRDLRRVWTLALPGWATLERAMDLGKASAD